MTSLHVIRYVTFLNTVSYWTENLFGPNHGLFWASIEDYERVALENVFLQVKAFENLMHGHQPPNIKLPVVGIVWVPRLRMISLSRLGTLLIRLCRKDPQAGRGDDLQMAQEVLHHEEPSSSTMEEMLLS
ncbi:unnamed protein product [Prunus armeniaca]